MIFSLTTFVHIKMSLYRFNRQELLQKVKDRYHNGGGKKESTEYYIANKDVLKEKAKKKYKNLSQEEKEAKRDSSQNRYKNIKKKPTKRVFKKKKC